MSLEQLKTDFIHWHSDTHPDVDNTPGSLSTRAIIAMSEQLLQPIEQHFAAIDIKCGFIGNPLRQVINLANKNPSQDQHAGSELDGNKQLVCPKQGIACDFYVKGYETNMYEVAQWIATYLPFDHMHLYGPDQPIHLSYGPDDSRLIQLIDTDDAGKQIPTKEVHAKDFDRLLE